MRHRPILSASLRGSLGAPMMCAALMMFATVPSGCEVRPPTPADEDTAPVDAGAQPADGTDNADVSTDDGTAATDTPKAEIVGEDCPGGPNCSCQDNAGCDSGFCIDTPAGKRCARTCVEECPGEFVCRQAPGGDVVNICVPRFGRLCDPCNKTETCQAVGLTGAVCVDYGKDGAFCGLSCSADADCGAGYACTDATSIEGNKGKQCVRLTAPGKPVRCPCTGVAALTALKTACYIETKGTDGKLISKCAGERVCATAGLSDCTAPEPEAETCDGEDNDCNGKVDEGTCDDDNPCTKDSCFVAPKDAGDGPTTGCKHEPFAGACDADNSACTEGDVCVEGVCKVGKKLDCDDANQCTTDACEPKTGCAHTFSDSAGCDDGNKCSQGALCNGGKCIAGETKTCDPGNSCVLGKCDFKTGNCTFEDVSDKTVCDDGNACTKLTACQKGACKGDAVDCEDSNPCTNTLCDKQKGCITNNNVKPCDDGDACTKDDTCLGGKCTTNAVACDDGKPCTKDSCDKEKGCQNVLHDGGCDADGNACTIGDKCVQGACIAGDKKVCNDGSDCTVDSCDAQSAACLFDTKKTEGLSCNADNSVCTVADACLSGSCQAGKTQTCDDGKPCTIDACDPKDGCKAVNSSAPCDGDGDACTVGDTCSDGKCVLGKLKDCDDKDGCTKDSCDPKTAACKNDGSLFEGQSCDADGSNCTTGDKCTGGKCVAGPTKSCDDSDPCTDDACNAQKGCTHAFNKAPCNGDDNPCTANDRCVDGLCKVGEVTDCDDSKPCTIDSCSVAKGGCVNDSKSKDGAQCDADGSVCSEVDKCDGGVCKPGSLKKCEDGNSCTDDSCDKLKGCLFAPNADPCSDGKSCTIGDKCKAGQCWPGAAKGCGDNNPCTQDQCDDATGKCTYVGKPHDGEPCDKDGSVCTVKDSCKDGECLIGTKTDCDDANSCTIDSCHATQGCDNKLSEGACSDGSKCTQNDVCKAGKCVTQPVVCDDKNPCTTDSCDPDTGCKFTADRDLQKCGDYKVCAKDVCTKVSCGDNQLHTAVEKCDAGNVDGKDCDDALGNGSWGVLACSGDCQAFDVGKCHDLSWMDRTDKCQGFRQAALFPTVRWAISASTTWDKNKVYECPKAYHTATTDEGKKLFTGAAKSEDIYWSKCGWHGMIWGAKERKLLRFADSDKTGAYKHTAFAEGYPVKYDDTVDDFAGVVCIKD